MTRVNKKWIAATCIFAWMLSWYIGWRYWHWDGFLCLFVGFFGVFFIWDHFEP